jgi:hypothetical protein
MSDALNLENLSDVLNLKNSFDCGDRQGVVVRRRLRVVTMRTLEVMTMRTAKLESSDDEDDIFFSKRVCMMGLFLVREDLGV